MTTLWCRARVNGSPFLVPPRQPRTLIFPNLEWCAGSQARPSVYMSKRSRTLTRTHRRSRFTVNERVSCSKYDRRTKTICHDVFLALLYYTRNTCIPAPLLRSIASYSRDLVCSLVVARKTAPSHREEAWIIGRISLPDEESDSVAGSVRVREVVCSGESGSDMNAPLGKQRWDCEDEGKWKRVSFYCETREALSHTCPVTPYDLTPRQYY